MTNRWNLKSPPIIGDNLKTMRITSDDMIMFPDTRSIIDSERRPV